MNPIDMIPDSDLRQELGAALAELADKDKMIDCLKKEYLKLYNIIIADIEKRISKLERTIDDYE